MSTKALVALCVGATAGSASALADLQAARPWGQEDH